MENENWKVGKLMSNVKSGIRILLEKCCLEKIILFVSSLTLNYLLLPSITTFTLVSSQIKSISIYFKPTNRILK